MRTLIAFTLLLLSGAVHARAFDAVSSLPASATRLESSISELMRPQGELLLNLPGGRRIQFTTRSEALASGAIGLRGRSAGSDHLWMFAANGELAGEIFAVGGHYRLVRQGSRHYWINARDDQRFLSPKGDWEPMPTKVRTPLTPYMATAATESPKAGMHEIDVLVVYTPLYEQRFGSKAAARTEAERMLFVANFYFETSNVPIRYRLVGAEKYTGTSESGDLRRNLSVTARDPAVKAYRDRIGADLVIHLRTTEGCSGLVGLSRGFNNFEQSDPPAALNPDTDGFAAAAMGPGSDGSQCEDWVFAHELGHNLAAGHHWAQHQADGLYWKPYSHGFQCGVSAQGGSYVTIMSYLSQFDDHGPYFSSPNLSSNGIPCGSAGVPAEALQADNVRAMTEAAPYVAAYKTRR